MIEKTATDLGVEWRQVMLLLERGPIDIKCVLYMYDITKNEAYIPSKYKISSAV